MSKSTLSRVESGESSLKYPLLRSLLAFYEIDDDEASALEQLFKDSSIKGWYDQPNQASSKYLRLLAGLENEADAVLIFQPLLMPGLLQTKEYATAVMKAFVPNVTADYIAAGVEFRLRRQDRLGHFNCWVILTEEVLHRKIGGPAVIDQQLAALSELAEKDNVHIQILPLTKGAHPGISGQFAVLQFKNPLDPNVVYMETPGGDLYEEDEMVVESFENRFDRLRAAALSFEESLELINDTREKGSV